MSNNADSELVGPKDTHDIKMSGDGEPGSHSAVFGLTPDGSKDDKTKSVTTPPANVKKGGDGAGEAASGDVGSRGSTAAGGRDDGV
jgi:hypothetical protein